MVFESIHHSSSPSCNPSSTIRSSPSRIGNYKGGRRPKAAAPFVVAAAEGRRTYSTGLLLMLLWLLLGLLLELYLK